MRILVVEDDAELRAAIVRAFALAGWDPWNVGTFDEAKLYIDMGQPDVVLTDRRLAGQGGEGLIGLGAPVILFTGLDTPIKGPQPLAVIRKPCSMADLVRRVTEALGRA